MKIKYKIMIIKSLGFNGMMKVGNTYQMFYIFIFIFLDYVYTQFILHSIVSITYM